MRFLASAFLLLAFLFFGVDEASAQLINEFVPDASPEWVEIYNNSVSSIDLSGYFFDDDAVFDSDGGNKPIIGLEGILSPGGLCYWDLSLFLNNPGDSPTLFNSTGAIVDSYPYTDSTPGKSYARVPDGGAWQADQEPTKTTNSCQSLAPTPTSTPTPTPNPTSTPTPTPSSTPTPKPTSTPTPKPSPSSTKAPAPLADSGEGGSGEVSGNTDILGLRAKLNDTESTKASVFGASEAKIPRVGIVLGGLGAFLVGVSLFIFLKRKAWAYNKESEETS